MPAKSGDVDFVWQMPRKRNSKAYVAATNSFERSSKADVAAANSFVDEICVYVFNHHSKIEETIEAMDDQLHWNANEVLQDPFEDAHAAEDAACLDLEEAHTYLSHLRGKFDGAKLIMGRLMEACRQPMQGDEASGKVQGDERLGPRKAACELAGKV